MAKVFNVGDTRLYTVDEKFRGEYMQFAENYLEKI